MNGTEVITNKNSVTRYKQIMMFAIAAIAFAMLFSLTPAFAAPDLAGLLDQMIDIVEKIFVCLLYTSICGSNR